MRSENMICPYCKEEYKLEKDIWAYEGEVVECKYCGKEFKVSDITAVTYITTQPIKD